MPGPDSGIVFPFAGMAAPCSNPVARARPDLSESASRSVNCYHCELPVLESGWELALEGKTQHFCCGGCLAVAEHLHTQGLTQYYQIRQSPGLKPDEATVDEQDMALLESRFARTMSADESRIELAVEGITCGGCAWLMNMRWIDLRRFSVLGQSGRASCPGSLPAHKNQSSSANPNPGRGRLSSESLGRIRAGHCSQKEASKRSNPPNYCRYRGNAGHDVRGRSVRQ